MSPLHPCWTSQDLVTCAATPRKGNMTSWKITLVNGRYIFKWLLFHCPISFQVHAIIGYYSARSFLKPQLLTASHCLLIEQNKQIDRQINKYYPRNSDNETRPQQIAQHQKTDHAGSVSEFKDIDWILDRNESSQHAQSHLKSFLHLSCQSQTPCIFWYVYLCISIAVALNECSTIIIPIFHSTFWIAFIWKIRDVWLLS